MKRRFPSLALLATLACAAAHAVLPRPAGAAFDKGALFAVAGYTGSAPLSGFPVLVRLAANSPSGFYYTDLHSPTNGADIAFIDTDGNGLPFEIDTWNPSGTSLIWVKLPTMTNGTKFVMCWGSTASGKTVCADSPFAGYVGVWHMSEASGTVADSSGHSLDAVPSGDGAAALSVAVSGPVGNGRQCSTDTTVRSYLTVPSYDSLNVGNTFAVSGWFNVGSGQTAKDARVFARKTYYTEANGWEVVWKNTKAFSTRGASSTADAQYSTAFGEGWKHFFIVYDGTTSTIYENGVQKARKTGGTAATDNNCALGIGDYPSEKMGPLVGSVDECRLLDAVPTADWAKAEYDSMSDASFLTAGEAESYGASAIPVAGILVSPIGYTNATVVVALSDFGTGATSADGALEVSATADFAAPFLTETYSAVATGSRSFGVSGLSTNATYYVRAFVTNNLQAMTAVGPVSFTTIAPGAPAGTVSLHERGVSSISATATVASSGTDAASAAVRLEVSADGFATTVSSAWEDVPANASRVLTVSGLASLTAYDVRLRLRNDWGIETVSDLGRIVTLPSSGVQELYVDSLGHGNGTSPESALPTIREALDIAGPGFTIWVRGGEDRSYVVSNDADTLRIPAALEGLSIRAYGETPGDGGRAALSVSASFIDDGNSMHIVSNAAPDVTFAGFTCSYGPKSLGVQNKPSVLFVAIAAPRFTIADCEFFCTGIPGYAASGANGIVAAIKVDGDWHVATGLLIERCFFHDTTGYRGDTAPYPLRVPTGTTIRECVFSNAWGVASDPGPGQTKYRDFTFVSNVVHSGPVRGGSPSFPHGLFSSGWGGFGGGAEIAYNVFVGTGEPSRGIFALARWDGLGGSERFHHNVVRNYGWVWGYNRNGNPTGKTVAQIFDNVFDLMEGGTVVRDEGFNGETVRVGTPIFFTGSFSRNNAIVAPGTFWGGASALAEDHDRSVVSPLDDIAIAEPPDWICTNDLFHADFYRYRANRHQAPDLGALGWRGENNEYPLWIGAKPPLYPEATLMILR